MGTGRTEGRCDLDQAAAAWPRVAVISSLPAHALLPIVEAVAQTWRVVPGVATAVASSGGLRLGWVASVVAGLWCAGCVTAEGLF